MIALLLLGTIRIVSTYSVFSYTFDEPAHLACGMEWLDKGVYTWEPQHPPLARVAASLGPYLMGIRSQNTPRTDIFSMTYEGLGVLFNNGRYDEAIGLARLGILPFYWIGCLTVYFWTRRYASRATAVIALFLFSFLPPILAHAGLATTDMACTAFLAAAFFAAVVWMEEPGPRTGALFRLGRRSRHFFQVLGAALFRRRRHLRPRLVLARRAPEARSLPRNAPPFALSRARGNRRIHRYLGDLPLLFRQSLLRRYPPSRAGAFRRNPRRAAAQRGRPSRLSAWNAI